VNGSFRPPEAVVAVGSALVEVVVPATGPPDVVFEPADEDPADVLGLVEPDEVDVVDLCVCECRPASGSTYCWSPAEPPPAAIALAGAPAEIEAATIRQPTPCLQLVILRVWQAMKLLAFSDLHRSRDHARSLVDRAPGADVVIGAGDFASMRLGLNSTIDSLASIDSPAILTPGNSESDTALWRACAGWPSASVLHGTGIRAAGVEFFGLGGGVPPTPFPWSFDLSEREAEEKLRDCPPGAVLIVHSPPRGYLDEVGGRHLGSRAILDAIDRVQPKLVVCGHIHQCWGREARIGPTLVVNVGPEGRLLEI
jgi:Icc-related predicted phosphoesterase